MFTKVDFISLVYGYYIMGWYILNRILIMEKLVNKRYLKLYKINSNHNK
jgi:hypothetical protein